MKPAPIALFVYNRPEHARKTIDALRRNARASESDLFIFSDGPRAGDEGRVAEVRSAISELRGFASTTVIEREGNLGLAASIIDGVTRLTGSHGRVIVLEDDIVTSPSFLGFMNGALEAYADERAVWSVSGWNYPISPDGLGAAFLWRGMNCWGWATWADRWGHFKKEPRNLVSTWGKEKIRRFNLDGAHDFWAQVVGNDRGALNTWAIFWYATIFEHGGLCLNPTRSLVENVGFDGTGENCGVRLEPQRLSEDVSVTDWPRNLAEDPIALERIKEYYVARKPSRWKQALRGLVSRSGSR